jgi:site-specific DNA-methyltransferase (adenine-specific)
MNYKNAKAEHHTENLSLYNMDCMELLKQTPDNYYDLAIVDPPYGIDCAKTINIANKKRGFEGNKIHESKKWDDDIPPKEYFDELKRVSKNQIMWGGNYFTEHLKPTKAWIFWDKKDTKNQGSNFSDGELAWTSFKKVTKLFQYGWIGIDYCNKNENKIHPTQKPVKLYEWLLQNYSEKGAKILDTHLGSMSSAIACHYFGAHLTGCELDEDYFKAGIERVENETRQLTLF